VRYRPERGTCCAKPSACMEIEVSARGLHGDYAPAYSDFAHVAAWLRSASVGWPLPPPRQGGNGDCWLLTAATGLQCFHPFLLRDMVTLEPSSATVSFPRLRPVTVNYVLPVGTAGKSAVVSVTGPTDLYWAILEKAVCKLLFLWRQPGLVEKRVRHGLGATCHAPHYVDLHGGRVSDALGFLSPLLAPKPEGQALVGSPGADTLKYLGATGLFFLEVARNGGWHSMLLVACTETHYLAYDPWGMTVAVPKGDCSLFYFQLRAAVSKAFLCCRKTAMFDLGT